MGRNGGLHHLVLGDSHAAGPALSTPVRTALKARGAYGGLGIINLDPNAKGYLNGVKLTYSVGWSIFNLLKPQPGIRYGLTGRTWLSTDPGQSLQVEVSDEADAFAVIVVCAGADDEEGAAYRLESREWSAEATASKPGCREFTLPGSVRVLVLTALSPGLYLTSVGLYASAPGTVVSSVGVGGAQLTHFGAAVSDDVLGVELNAHRVGSMALLYGTNEAFNVRFDAALYEAQAERLIAKLERLSGGRSPALIGVPRVATDKGFLIRERSGVRYCSAGAAKGAPRTFVPPNWDLVRQTQASLAARLRLRFLDLAAAMGEVCAAEAWATARPPLMRPDRVHFSLDGGRTLAPALLDFLVR